MITSLNFIKRFKFCLNVVHAHQLDYTIIKTVRSKYILRKYLLQITVLVFSYANYYIYPVFELCSTDYWD